MLNIGMTELFVFGIIALLVLGPDKLPEAARFSGKWYGKLKRLVSNVQNDIDRELRMSELKEQMQNEMKRIQELEYKMQAQMQALQQQKPMASNDTPKTTTLDPQHSFARYRYVEQKQHLVLRQANLLIPPHPQPQPSQIALPRQEVLSSVRLLQEAV